MSNPMEKGESLAAPETAGKDHEQAADKMLYCVREDIPMLPHTQADAVYEQGKSGNDFLAARFFDTYKEGRPPGGVSFYELNTDDKLYIDFIQANDTSHPGANSISSLNNRKLSDLISGSEVKPGSDEYKKVIDLIYNQQLFDNCKRLP